MFAGERLQLLNVQPAVGILAVPRLLQGQNEVGNGGHEIGCAGQGVGVEKPQFLLVQVRQYSAQAQPIRASQAGGGCYPASAAYAR
jgi:hypothetical protein